VFPGSLEPLRGVARLAADHQRNIDMTVRDQLGGAPDHHLRCVARDRRQRRRRIAAAERLPHQLTGIAKPPVAPRHSDPADTRQ
jgi:hypothetical protein